MEALFKKMEGQEIRITALIQIIMCFMAIGILMHLEARKLEKSRKKLYK